MKKIFWALLVLIFTIACTGCASKSNATTNNDGQLAITTSEITGLSDKEVDSDFRTTTLHTKVTKVTTTTTATTTITSQATAYVASMNTSTSTTPTVTTTAYYVEEVQHTIPSVETLAFEYTVQYGDTLYSIACAYGTNMDDIKYYNGLYDDTIYVGQVIFIPTYSNSSENYYYDGNSNYSDYNNNNNNNTTDLSAYTATLYTSGAGYDSWYNIELAASYLNGLVLEPGQSFSWACYMGPNDESQGYIEAGVYIVDDNGNTISGTAPGGGVCFVSTTLMQAARGAGCVITEAHNHSAPVSYATPGNEASVSYGSLDLKFYNPSSTTALVFYASTDSYNCGCTITASPYYY